MLDPIKSIDNVDDRNEIRNCVEKMNHPQQVAYVQWCCDKAAEFRPKHLPKLKVVIQKKEGERGATNEILVLLMLLIVRHGLPTRLMVEELERRARDAVLIGTAGRFIQEARV